MRIALISPSNLLYTPYIDNYLEILDEIQIQYDIINWDRFCIEEKIETIKYRDTKKGHKRNYIDYLKYSKFILNILDKNKYDKIIVFGIQLTFFLSDLLVRNLKDNFIIDIRDYNKTLYFFNIKKVIESSFCAVISSPAYMEWLPKSNKYVINHNTKIKSLNELKSISSFFEKESIIISNIGALRDYKININFINSLKNKNKYLLYFHGEGDINYKLKTFVKNNNISNVIITGRYERNIEESLYNQSDFINVLRYNDGINNKTALPNRLYNSLIYGKPVLAFKGTYLANIVNEYGIGLVLESFMDIEEKISYYLRNFDVKTYELGRRRFFEVVLEENNKFENKLIEFIKNRWYK